MFSLYDLAEIGACFAAFFTLLFIMVRKPGHASAQLYVLAALATLVMWSVYIVIVPRSEEMTTWQQGLLVSALSIASSLWLLFLRVFARESSASIMRDRRLTVYVLVALFAASAVAAFFTPFVSLKYDQDLERFFLLSALGKYYLVVLIISFTFSLFQLESTFRASVGQVRRALRWPALATATVLGLLLISAMIGLLYARIDFVSIQLTALASIIAMVLISRFLVFEATAGQSVVISREAMYSSVAVLLVGAYFLLIGVSIWLLVSIGGSPKVFLSVLAAFLAIVVFVGLFFSSSIKTRWRGLVDRSLYSGKLDLLTELSAFAEDVSVATDKREMFACIVSVLEQRCQMKDVAIALSGERRGEFDIGYPASDLRTVQLPAVQDWLFRAGRMLSRDELLPYLSEASEQERNLAGSELREYLVPLLARKELVGFITCNAATPINNDIRFLIDSMSHQLALSLLSAKQSEILLETRELASFSKVSSFVIHDVKNLISMLSMILQNAEKKFGEPRFQQMTIETLQGAQERMKRLIGRLTSPSQQSEVRLSDCDLKQLVLDLIEEMKLPAQRKIALETSLDDVPHVRGNADNLKSVLSNLFINAIEAMPNGGRLILKSESEPGAVVLMVEDTGTGMSPDFIRERLFRPFQTSKAGGLGIGMFQSKELVEQMNGELTVTSTVGQGTCFSLKLRSV